MKTNNNEETTDVHADQHLFHSSYTFLKNSKNRDATLQLDKLAKDCEEVWFR